MIVDGHTHMLQGWQPLESLKRRVEDLKDIDMDQLIVRLNELGVDKMVTLAQEMTRVSKAWLGSNELAADLQMRYPSKIVGIVGGEPLDEKDAFNAKRLRDFEEAVKEHRIKGLLFTPPYGHFYANDKRAYPFYEKAVELDVAVYFHHAGGAGGGGGPAFFAPLKYARPWLLDDVVIDFPDLRINVEHMGYPWTEELLALMKHAPNVYTDIAQLFSRPTLLAWDLMMAKEYGVIDKVFWGSDYVGEDLNEYALSVRKETEWVKTDLNRVLERAGWPTLSQGEIDGILNKNARKLLKLK